MIKTIGIGIGAVAVIITGSAYSIHKRKSPMINLKTSQPIVNKGGIIAQEGNRLVISKDKELHILEDNGSWSICESKYSGTTCISTDGITLIIGCPDAPRGKRNGRVLIYRKRKDNWALFDELFPSHSEKDGCFGRMVKLKDDKLLVAGDTMWAIFKETNGKFYQMKYMFAEGPYELAFPGLVVCKRTITDFRDRVLYEYDEFKGPRCIVWHDPSGLILGWDMERKIVAGNQTFTNADQMGFGQSITLTENNIMFVLSDTIIHIYSYLDEWQFVSLVTLPKMAITEIGKMMWCSNDKLFLSCPSLDLVYTWNILKH